MAYIDKWCPRCNTFNGGFGGRPDSNYCYNCGLDLMTPMVTDEEAGKLAAAAFAAGVAEGRRLEAADALKHMEVPS